MTQMLFDFGNQFLPIDVKWGLWKNEKKLVIPYFQIEFNIVYNIHANKRYVLKIRIMIDLLPVWSQSGRSPYMV